MRWASFLSPTVVTIAMTVMRSPSECREILALLPVAHFGIEAVDLGLLQLQVIVDEEIAEAGAENLVVAQGRQRLLERARQQRRLGLVGRVGGRAGLGLALD